MFPAENNEFHLLRLSCVPGTGRDTDFYNSGHLRLELVSIILFIAKLALG